MCWSTVGPDRLQARDVVLVVLGGDQRHVLGHAGQTHVEPGVGVEGNLIGAVLEVADAILELRAEDLVVDAILGVESLDIDGIELGHKTAGGLDAGFQVRVADRRHQVIPLIAPHRGRSQWIRFESRFPLAIEELMKLGRRPTGGVGMRRGAARQQDTDHQMNRLDAIAHTVPPGTPLTSSHASGLARDVGWSRVP